MAANRSTLRTMQILEFIANSEKPCTLACLSKVLPIPKTSILDILKALNEAGYIRMADSELVSYCLDLKAFQLGQKYLKNIDVFKICEPFLDQMANTLDKTILLATLNGPQVVYLAKREPSTRFVGVATAGISQPAHCTGLGKAMLAALSDEEVLELLGPGPYQKKTEHTITKYQDLVQELQRIRERGYSIDDCENEVMIYCVALPVRNDQGQPVLGISATGVKGQYAKATALLASQIIGRVALDASHKLGFKGKNLY